MQFGRKVLSLFKVKYNHNISTVQRIRRDRPEKKAVTICGAATTTTLPDPLSTTSETLSPEAACYLYESYPSPIAGSSKPGSSSAPPGGFTTWNPNASIPLFPIHQFLLPFLLGFSECFFYMGLLLTNSLTNSQIDINLASKRQIYVKDRMAGGAFLALRKANFLMKKEALLHSPLQLLEQQATGNEREKKKKKHTPKPLYSPPIAPVVLCF